MRLASRLLALALSFTLAAGCSDKSGGKPRIPNMPDPTEEHLPLDQGMEPSNGQPPEEPDAPQPPTRANREAEVFPPLWTRVGVGQTVSFSVAAIDQDLDDVTVTVPEAPPTARFDAITQTVTWTPDKTDLAAGKRSFRVHLVEHHPDGTTAEQDALYELEVTKAKQPAPVAPWLDEVGETVLTIREPRRLEQVNKDWPLDKLLETSAKLLRATLAPEVQGKLGKLDRKALLASVLAGLAETHHNPRLDPRAKEFDKKVFGDPRAWRIVTVRPRIDKKFHELRVVYQAVKAPEPVFVMFRLRPVWDVPTLPPEARALNNKAFAELLARDLLSDGGVNPKFVKDAKAHGKAVAKLVKDVLAFEDKAQPWARAGFIALPTEARMGGGSKRGDDGGYVSGDGWAWSVMKPLPTADGTSQAYVNVPIPGFWTEAVASADSSAWVARCARKFDPDDAGHAAGYEVLCRKAQGFVDQPELVDGKVVSAKRDAANLFVEHKNVDAVAALPLDDPRRDQGEENGMSCAQCHIRNFGVRDYSDPATLDPRAGLPRGGNHPIPTLDFQIIPGQTWPTYMVEFMKDQECKAARNLEAALGKPSKLTCSLAP